MLLSPSIILGHTVVVHGLTVFFYVLVHVLRIGMPLRDGLSSAQDNGRLFADINTAGPRRCVGE